MISIVATQGHPALQRPGTGMLLEGRKEQKRVSYLVEYYDELSQFVPKEFQLNLDK